MPNAVKTQKFVMTNVDRNNNKFWQYTLFDDNSVECRWGRVGEPGQSKMFPHSSVYAADVFISRKISEKLGKGYREFEDAADGSAPAARSVVGAVKLAEVATEQIEHQDPLVSNLIKRLADVNRHNILNNTALTYNASGQYAGMFSTSLGVVTPASLHRARAILSQIGDALGGSSKIAEYELKRFVEDYMMLVPVDIGRRRLTITEVFPNIYAVQRQSNVLDSLDASLQMIASGTLNAALGEGEVGQAPAPRVFDVSLTLASATVLKTIEQMFRSSMNRSHESSRLSPVRVLEVNIRQMRERFEKDGVQVGNVQRLWHGTRVANVLSILKSGLVIPPASSSHCTGRMYGDGIYASDQSTKSLNYSYGFWDGGRRDNNCMMFVVEMAMGKPYIPGAGPYPKAGYDSTFAKAGVSGVRNNEMIVYRPSQVNPLYLVEFEG